MADLEELYREIILDHYRSPRNRGELDSPPAHRVEGFNPLCGDEVVVSLVVEDGTLADLKIGGSGCSISQSSASLMSAAVKGKPVGARPQETVAATSSRPWAKAFQLRVAHLMRTGNFTTPWSAASSPSWSRSISSGSPCTTSAPSPSPSGLRPPPPPRRDPGPARSSSRSRT